MKSMHKHFSTTDRVVIAVDKIIASLLQPAETAARTYPAQNMDEGILAAHQKKVSAGLMRVNHAGEISAQALYKAQMVASKNTRMRAIMRRAANEEIDHLHWCRRRLTELEARSSLFDPFWFCGSFAIGLLAGSAGDRWSLGFLAETERQVVKHLDSHLCRLPQSDGRSRAIIKQMKQDEAEHATTAIHAGANELPKPIKAAMRYCSQVMTTIAYRI